MENERPIQEWHNRFKNAEKVILFDAAKFCHKFGKDLLSDINNEKVERRSEIELHDHVLKGVPYFYKDFLIDYCIGEA